MSAAQLDPVPQSWIDLGDVVIQDSDGYTVRIPADDLAHLYATARDSDDGTARWRGHDWDRDHLNGAVSLAQHAGVLDTCTYRDHLWSCDRPAPYDPRDARPRCYLHKREDH